MDVSTLLEILETECVEERGPVYLHRVFQPFLRFWVKCDCYLVLLPWQLRVSTLLEILAGLDLHPLYAALDGV